MSNPPRFSGRPIYPVLVPVALGLWTVSLVCDGVFVFASSAAAWKTLAYHSMAGGVVAVLAGAGLALFELRSLPPEARRDTLVHAGINLAVAGLYVLNLWQRSAAPDNVNGPVFLSAIAIAVLVVSGWLGGHLAYVGDVAAGVADQALRKRLSPQKMR